MKSIEEVFYSTEKKLVKWSGYFDVYDKHLSKFIGKSPKVLEIGVLTGGSIEMWLKYFGEGSEVVGIDIDPKCLNHKYEGNAKIVIGDQGSEDFWKSFLADNTEFDVVIDDGGHTMQQQITTLQQVFPHVREGGVFICEDTHTSYWPNPWGGEFKKPNTFLEYTKDITDIVNQQHFENKIDTNTLETYKNLYSVSYYNSMVVLEKEELKPFVVIDRISP